MNRNDKPRFDRDTDARKRKASLKRDAQRRDDKQLKQELRNARFAVA